MKNKARPLSVDRLGFSTNSALHYKHGFRGIYKAWTMFNIFSTKTMNQLNDDCN